MLEKAVGSLLLLAKSQLETTLNYFPRPMNQLCNKPLLRSQITVLALKYIKFLPQITDAFVYFTITTAANNK